MTQTAGALCSLHTTCSSTPSRSCDGSATAFPIWDFAGRHLVCRALWAPRAPSCAADFQSRSTAPCRGARDTATADPLTESASATSDTTVMTVLARAMETWRSFSQMMGQAFIQVHDRCRSRVLVTVLVVPCMGSARASRAGNWAPLEAAPKRAGPVAWERTARNCARASTPSTPVTLIVAPVTERAIQ